MKKKISNNLLISYHARKKYNLDKEKFKAGNRIFFDSLYDIRTFTEKLNKKRNLLEFPEAAISTGDIYGMSLIQDIFQYIVKKYEDKYTDVFAEILKGLKKALNSAALKKTYQVYVSEFPDNDIVQHFVAPGTAVNDIMANSEKEINIIKELSNIYLYNTNPAFSDFIELFSDEKLSKTTIYTDLWDRLVDQFEEAPGFGPQNENLLKMLTRPAKEVPHSIQGQLDWIRNNWREFLDDYLYRILISLDLITEENKQRGLGAGEAYVHRFDHVDAELEYEKFSQDKDWMPKVVILAKNTHVWLDQLSKQYQKEIKHLDDIPDEELDRLQQRGMTSLWLIGLWERSVASKTIKQLMGNQDAVASAYSLLDYSIAEELGGDAAFHDLKERAIKRGIRLCGDMVPNHVGIDANWVIHHPDWFISLDHPPFPSYNFSGENLCNDDRVGVYLEDHYFEKTDAAVVFKRVDHHTGDTRYIYHGNDGTSMPWNDTAQLNYLKKEVREAVIQTILHVARNFDVIRFDAAMTLAKKHYQRLWFPQPGSGGDIPSRAEHAMTKEEFNSFFPKEFWREVVDRVQEEEPDTLLLAEAFWMMEGYFVRTLGMHRVYNSAFMNMLKNEDNEKYRNTIKNVLEFNPEILKRYVNFMNNPDEETAIVQFGDNDKYFGVCLMMATMPGLPMFGHGQVEGFKEKYGMEFKRAYWNETPNEELVRRHEKEIFPLLHKRYLFSEVKNFQFYDYITADGHINHNVFAYSNSAGDEKALIFYNNTYDQTTGWIKNSVNVNRGNDEFEIGSLGEALKLKKSEDHFVIFRDQVSGLQYIRSSKDIHYRGIFTILKGFEYHAFMDFQEVEDFDGLYNEVNAFLNGRGVPSIESAIQQVLVRPVHVAFKKNFNADMMTAFFEGKKSDQRIAKIKKNNRLFLEALKDYTNVSVKTSEKEFNQTLDNYFFLLSQRIKSEESKKIKKLLKKKENQFILYSWLLIHSIGMAFSTNDWERKSRSLIDELFLNKLIKELGHRLKLTHVDELVELVMILTKYQNWYGQLNKAKLSSSLKDFLSDFNVRTFTKINRYKSILWFNKEAFEKMMIWLKMVALFNILRDNYPSMETIMSEFEDLTHLYETIGNAIEKSDYRLEKLLEYLE